MCAGRLTLSCRGTQEDCTQGAAYPAHILPEFYLLGRQNAEDRGGGELCGVPGAGDQNVDSTRLK